MPNAAVGARRPVRIPTKTLRPLAVTRPAVAFRDLALVFEKLEHTSSSTTMIEILARVLPTLAPHEARIAAYLLSGNVGPSYSAPEFGIADKLAARAVAQAYDVSLARVDRMSVRAGDIGAVAEELAAARRGAHSSLVDVFDALTQIAQTSGSGAQRSKTALLVELLQRASAVEAKYVIRTVLGTHRIGAAEMTFLRGLARTLGGSAEDRRALEYAYNVFPDLGEVAFRVVGGERSWLEHVSPKPGVPVRMMLASRVDDLDEVPLHLKRGMFVEYKYDGERAQIHKDAGGTMRIFSRRLEDITGQYPEVIAHLEKNLTARSVIVEGEVVAIDRKTGKLLPFQVVMQRKRTHDIARYQRDVPVALFLFDILYLDGRNLLSTPLTERKRLLAGHLKADATASVGAFVRTTAMRDVRSYFRRALAHGAEGVVIKGASSPYRAGHRGWHWIKFKKEYERQLADTFDLVVVGALHGRGKRTGVYGSLLVAAFDPKTAAYYSLTKVGAGLTDALLRAMPKLLKPYVIPHKHRMVETGMKMDVWFEPSVVVEISGADLTVSPVHRVAQDHVKEGGIALRFPRFLRIRDDKTAEQATTVREIWDMYVRRSRSAGAGAHR